MKGLLGLIVADDPDETFERLLPYICHQLNTYRAAAAAGTGRTPSVITPEKIREQRARPGTVPPIEVHTPDGAIERLRGVAAAVPADEVYCWASVAGMPDDLVARHVELLGHPGAAGAGRRLSAGRSEGQPASATAAR